MLRVQISDILGGRNHCAHDMAIDYSYRLITVLLSLQSIMQPQCILPYLTDCYL